MKFINNTIKIIVLVLIIIYLYEEINFKNVIDNFNLNYDLIIFIFIILFAIRVGVFYFSMKRWNLLLNISFGNSIPLREISKLVI